jgi:hypothetical protein
MKKIWICAGLSPAFGGGVVRSFHIIVEEDDGRRDVCFNTLSEVAEYLPEERGELGLAEAWITLDKPCDIAFTPYCTFPERYESLTEEEKKELLQRLKGTTYIHTAKIIENWQK